MIPLRQRLLTPGAPRLLGWLFIAQIFTVFLTGVKIVPGIRNNFGPFEILGAILIVVYLAPRIGRPAALRLHPVITIQTALSILALLSLIWFQGPALKMGIVQNLILIFQLLFILATLNFMLEFQVSPEKLLRLVTYSALVIGPWVLLSGMDSELGIQAAGPFRNRAHMANYMLTAFWLVLLFNSWPGISKRDRLLSYLALASTLYPIAISGRRSVYLSLIFGLVGVALSFLAAARGRRRGALLAAVVIFASIGVMYAIGPRWMPQLEFFQNRVASISDRLDMAVGDSGYTTENFFDLQRTGVVAAFRDSPLGGIGWGAFYRSRFSPTGHEVHSTPMRFLAELGLVGFSLYVAMMGILLIGSLRIIALVRNTAYRSPAVILAIAMWSLAVSFIYNRHITERTFWLLLLFYLAFEAFARTIAWHQHNHIRARRGSARSLRPRQVAAALVRHE